MKIRTHSTKFEKVISLGITFNYFSRNNYLNISIEFMNYDFNVDIYFEK